MKKIIYVMMLVICASTTFISCKKDKKTEKEKTLELLVSGKWYYQSANSSTCFNESNYWEFKADGTFNETWDYGAGTYTLSDDGKTITLTLLYNTETLTITITNINATSFSFAIKLPRYTADQLVLGKTALSCGKK